MLRHRRVVFSGCKQGIIIPVHGRKNNDNDRAIESNVASAFKQGSWHARAVGSYFLCFLVDILSVAFLDSEAILALRLPAASVTGRKARLVVRVRGHSSLGFAVQALGWSSSSSVFVRSPASPSFGNSVTFFIGGGRAVGK
jgi:hypothetical protein